MFIPRGNYICILCRCHFQFSSAERKYIFLVIPRRGILLWTSFSRVQRKERKSRETRESNWSPFSGGEKIHSCTVKRRDDVVVPLDSCCSFTTHRDEFPIIPAIQTYTSHHTCAFRCAHISFASNCRQDFSWHGCKTTTVEGLPLQRAVDHPRVRNWAKGIFGLKRPWERGWLGPNLYPKGAWDCRTECRITNNCCAPGCTNNRIY